MQKKVKDTDIVNPKFDFSGSIPKEYENIDESEIVVWVG